MGFFVFLVLVVVVVVVVLNNIKKTRRIEEFKNSKVYALALEVVESMENMVKGCKFGEPSISYYDGDADARFTSFTDISSERPNSESVNNCYLTIQTVLSSVTRSVMEVNTISHGDCVLDMGPLCIHIKSGKNISYKSQEMIDFLKSLATNYTGASNLYCNAKLIASYVNGKPSDTPSDSLPNRLQ